MATALIGMSSDGSRRAVFAALTADGGLVQVHTEQAVDGLAPAGTVGGLPVLEDTQRRRYRAGIGAAGRHGLQLGAGSDPLCRRSGAQCDRCAEADD